jgi:hypothetical protein
MSVIWTNWNVAKERVSGLIIKSVTKFARTDTGKPQKPSLRVFLVAAYIPTSTSAYARKKLYRLQLHLTSLIGLLWN